MTPLRVAARARARGRNYSARRVRDYALSCENQFIGRLSDLPPLMPVSRDRQMDNARTAATTGRHDAPTMLARCEGDITKLRVLPARYARVFPSLFHNPRGTSCITWKYQAGDLSCATLIDRGSIATIARNSCTKVVIEEIMALTLLRPFPFPPGPLVGVRNLWLSVEKV